MASHWVPNRLMALLRELTEAAAEQQANLDPASRLAMALREVKVWVDGETGERVGPER